MARISFYIFKETNIGEVVLDRDVNVNQLTAYCNGVKLPDPDFVNNGDGTVYFEASGSGEYSIRLDGKNQDEFFQTNVIDDDAVGTSRIDNTSIHIDPNHNRLRVSGSVMSQSMVINNQASSETDQPLSGLQGRELNYEIGQLSGDNASVLRTTDIVNSFTASTFTTRNIQSAESMLVNFNDTYYVSEETTYISALRKLDQAMLNITTGSLSNRKYMSFGSTASLLVDHDTDEIWMSAIDSTTTRGGPFAGGAYYTHEDITVTGVTFQFTVLSQSATSRIFPTLWYQEPTKGSVGIGFSGNWYLTETGSFGATFETNIPVPEGFMVAVSMELDDTSGYAHFENVACLVETTT